METIFVRPAPGAKVRDPVTKAPIPEAGVIVPNDGFWNRRLRLGDVILVEETPTPTKSKSAKE